MRLPMGSSCSVLFSSVERKEHCAYHSCCTESEHEIIATYVKAVAGISLLILLLQVSVAAAEQAKLALTAPIPRQILVAKKVFIANAGGDERPDDSIFNGGPQRVYDAFYAEVKAAGRYEIVDTPADADILFEIGFTAPMVSGAGARGDSLAIKPYDPQLRLAIRDPKTNALLWAFTEHVQWAILQGNRDKNFDQTLARIVRDLRSLSAASESANKP